ncbi:MAG: DNA-3-methyladenine glycosylase I, partial [Schleiferilactobacillus harbinensis]
WSFQGADGKTVAKDMKQRGFTFVGPTTIQLMLVGTGIAPRPMK